jgi:hypothetical protein
MKQQKFRTARMAGQPASIYFVEQGMLEPIEEEALYRLAQDNG